MVHDEMQDKHNHTIYVTNECIEMAQQMADEWGVSRNHVFERAIRAFFHARSAITYRMALEMAREELRQEREDEP